MDNRITRKRVSNFLAYEWILIAVLCAVFIFVWELVYSVSAVRLTSGQHYKFFYDYYMDYNTTFSDLMRELELQDDLGYSNGKTFSFDVQKVESEKVYDSEDTMSYRIYVQEGDMLFTDDSEHKLSGHKNPQVLAAARVDGYTEIMTYDKLLADAQNYLKGLLVDGQTEIKAENLDPAKIAKGFEDRLGDDNRFRSEEQKQLGLQMETERLQKLCKDVNDFEKILNLPDECFFTYTRYTQSKKIAIEEEHSQEVIDGHEANIQKEISAGRENARYGLKLDKVNEIKATTAGKVDSSKYFSWTEADDNGVITGKGTNIVVLLYDFLDYQPELQFESIAVINNIVRLISTALD